MPAFCPLWSHGLWVRTGFESASQISVNWSGLCIMLVVSLIRLTALHSAFLDLQTYIPLFLIYTLTFRFSWFTHLHSAFHDLHTYTYIPLSLTYRLTFRFSWFTHLHSAFHDLHTYIPLSLTYTLTFRFPWLTDLHSTFLDLHLVTDLHSAFLEWRRHLRRCYECCLACC